MTAPIQRLFMQGILKNFEEEKKVDLDLQDLLENPEHLEETFELLETLLPKLPFGAFEECVMQSLSKLLNCSNDLPEKQCRLAYLIAKRYLEEKSLKDAMRYSATALNIARQYGLETASIEEIESQIFLSFLDAQHSRIRREFEAVEKNPEAFHQKLKELLTLRRFCRMGESLQKVVDLFQIAQEVKKRLNPASRQLLESSRDLLIQGRTLRQLPSDWTFITEEYRRRLQEYRDGFKNEVNETLREKQRSYTQNFKTFFNHLMKDAFILLGPPPCSYLFCSMGSISREEPTPYSDLEWILLIEYEKERSYFETLRAFFELQCISIGETPAQHTPVFSSCLPKEGFHSDTGGGDFLVGTPEEIAKTHVNADIKPRSITYTIHQLVPLQGNETLFQRFIEIKKERMPPDVQQSSVPNLLATRRADFLKYQKFVQEGIEEPSLKRDYIEPIFHLLRDFALYYGIERHNTLDLLEELPLFSEETTRYLKEIVSLLYTLRLQTDDPRALDSQERERIESLLIEPLYYVLLDHFPPRDTKVDLFELKLQRILSTKELLTRESMTTFCKQISSLNLSEATLTKYYQLLSNQMQPVEHIRQAYLETLHDPVLKEALALIPNPKGYRQIERIKREEFHTALLGILTPYEETSSHGFTIQLSGPHFENQKFFLKKELMDEILDPKTGNLKSTYKNTQSRVTRSDKHPLHFKQAPSTPSKESPFHPGKERAASSLMFRLFGHGTSVGELVEFTVDHPQNGKKSYLVQISKTIPGTNLADASQEQLQALDSQNLTEFFLSLPLLLPGDMRPANMIVQDRKLISIDNDVSWVYPMTKGVTYGHWYHIYTILPFLFPQHTLHRDAIEKFLTLKPGPLLVDWLEELVAYNKGVQKHFSRYEDLSGGVSIRALFAKGMGGQLFSQFMRLQTFLRERPGAIPALDVFKALISFHEDTITDIGQKLYERYSKGLTQKGTPSDQVKWVTSREAASATKSTASFYKNLPTSEEGLKDYLPETLLQEISNLLVLDFGNFFFQDTRGVARLEKGFEEIPDSTQHEIFLKALVQHRYEALNLSHCTALTDEALAVFLKRSQATLKTLTLRHCSQLTVKALPLIMACTNLEELYLSHSEKIERFVSPRTVVKDLPAQFPKLQTLHLSHCPSLTTFNIEALELKVLKIDNNPRLKKGVLEAPGCEVISENSPVKLEYGAVSLEKLLKEPAFGKKKWELFFGNIGIEPPLPPNIQEILNAPCPIWPDKKVYETHLLTLIPQTVNGEPLTLKALGEFVQKPLQGPATKYRDLSLGEYKDPPNHVSHWTLLSRDVIPNSRNKRYVAQAELAQQYPGYEIPHILDATVSIFMEHVQSGTRLYSDKPYTYTRCQEKYDADWQLAVGGFAAGGLFVLYVGEHEGRGVGLSRMF